MAQTSNAVTLLTLALMCMSPMVVLPTRAAASTSTTYFDYVVVIVLENRSINQTYGSSCLGNCTYFTQLANQNSLAEGYSAVIHDSLPNYLALTSGWTQRLVGTPGDCSPLPTSTKYCPNVNPQLNNQFPFASTTIVDRLESAGLTWKAYMEDFPSSCSYQNPNQCSSGQCYVGYGGQSGKYDNEHDPFVYYSDISGNSNRCARIVPSNSTNAGYPDDRLISDLSSTTTASNFMWITPNVCDDMHDTCSGPGYQTDGGACPSNPTGTAQCVTQGNAYLANLVPKILSSNIFQKQRAALFITGDEGQGAYPSDYVTSIWAGPSSVVKSNYKSANQYNHYSFLKTLETNWNLQALNQTTDGQASDMSEFLIPPPNPPSSQVLPLTTILEVVGAIAAVVIVSFFVYRTRKRKKTSNNSPSRSSQPANP